jgi:uncharacterized protein YecE (DUF72 family)
MPLPPSVFCGPAGWSYPHWNGSVFPKTKPRGFHALESIAQYFDAVEINTTFYQSLRPEISRLWVRKVSTNPRFLFTAKLHRRFTHERNLDETEVTNFKEGLFPLLRAKKLGCLLMQFPWTFRYTEENRSFLIHLRRTFHEFQLVAEMRHSSWTQEEALGTLIDYRVGFCNIDQAEYTKATPPTEVLTTGIGYVRLHGRNPQDWKQELRLAGPPVACHDYLYSTAELLEWKPRVEHLREHAERVFVISNNDIGGKAVVNALQMAALLGDDRREAPAGLLTRYPLDLVDFHSCHPLQVDLFQRAVA